MIKNSTFLICLFLMTCVFQLQGQHIINSGKTLVFNKRFNEVPVDTIEYATVYFDNLLLYSKGSGMKMNLYDDVIDLYGKKLNKHKFRLMREVIPVSSILNDSTRVKDLYFYSHKVSAGFCLINKIISKRILEHKSELCCNRNIYVHYFYNGNWVHTKKEIKILSDLQLNSFRISNIYYQRTGDVTLNIYINPMPMDHHLKYSFYQSYHVFPSALSYGETNTKDYVFQDNLLRYNALDERCCVSEYNEFKLVDCDSIFISNTCKNQHLIKSRYDIQKEILKVGKPVNIWMYDTSIAQDGFLYLNDLINDCFFEYYNAYSTDTVGIEYIYNNQKIETREAYRKLMLLRKKNIRISAIINDVQKGCIRIYFTNNLKEYRRHIQKYLRYFNEELLLEKQT